MEQRDYRARIGGKMPSQDLSRVLNHIRGTSKDEREKGSRFEKLMVAFFKNDSRYKGEFENIWLWDQYPDRNHRDLGIDLVAQTYYGDLVAIQCKFYQESTVLSKRNIDSFLNELGKKKFQSGIIVSTTDRWGANAEKALQGRSKKCVRLGISDLEDSDIQDWWGLYRGAKASLPNRKKLREHQSKAHKDVFAGFKKHDRGRVVMPCGTGKTLTALRIVEKACGKSGTALILMPSLSLVSQTHREFMQNSTKKINAFIVCSDSQAGRDSEDIGFMDLAMPPTTDHKVLAQRLKLTSEESGKITIIFSTYHSIKIVAKAQKESKIGPLNLIICDEAHRTTGVESKTKPEDKRSYWTQVHDNSFIKARKRLYMTATPRVYTAQSQRKAKSRDYDIYSMDKEDIYGPLFHELKFSKAISQGLLSDYKVVVLAVNEDVVSEAMQDAFAEDGEIKTDDAVKIVGCWNALAKEFLNKKEKDLDVMGEGYKDIKNKRPMQRAVAFSSTIKESQEFQKHFEQVIQEVAPRTQDTDTLKCTIRHVDGTMNSLERGSSIRWLKGEGDKIESNQCRILSNARCLSEGVDVPSLDAVMFLKPRKSEIDIVQAVGRVMRKSVDPGQRKEFGYIILPIVVQAGLEPHEALKDNKRYEVIWKVVQALRSHDDRLEMEIDKLPYNKKLPSSFLPDFIFKKRKGKEGEEAEKGGEREVLRQLRFAFLQNWERAIVAKLVNKCGDREYLGKLAKDVKDAFDALSKRMKGHLKNKRNDKYKQTLKEFLESLRETLNDSITDDEAIDMLAMHSVTRPLFSALFEADDDNFANHNPVSRSMDETLKLFRFQTKAESKNLTGKYESIKKRAGEINTLEGRQNLIKEIYQTVFKEGFPKVQEQLGIVYTPVELVDFVLESCNEILKREFGGESLSSEKVKILDPFSGTGTFLTRLIENKELIKDKDLKRKYNDEILSSEIVLLAYYITTINVECSYHFRKQEIKGKRVGYEHFKGAVFADTFQTGEGDINQESLFFKENDEQRKRLQKEEIRVIVGNPPYSVGQKNNNDNNKNLKYEKLDENIRNTYVKESKAQNKNACYDSYIRAIRWASDKIKSSPKGGIVSFVTNASFIDANSMDGLRHHLEKDFTSLYVFNLRGDQRTKGERSRKEGGKIFGAGSRLPIAISFLVKNPQKKKCTIQYYDIGDYLNQKQKLWTIKNFKSVFGINQWQKIIPDRHNDWINQRDEKYEAFFSMGSKDDKNKNIFQIYSSGVKTNRDAWVYNFDKENLIYNVKRTIDFYNQELKRLDKEGLKTDIHDFVDSDPAKISWSDDMKQDLINKKTCYYEKSCFKNSMYRPFCKMNLYHNRRLNNSVHQTYRSYPFPEVENLAICTSGKSAKRFSVLMTNVIPNLHFLDTSQHFPRYTFQEEFGEMKKVDNISKSVVKKFREHYGDKTINGDKIFFYIYGFLHSKGYVNKYENDLLKDIPRIPMVNDFSQFATIGKKLADLHVNYESVPEYRHKDFKVEIQDGLSKRKNLYRVEKMKHPKTGKEKDISVIVYNDHVKITGIPSTAYQYEVNGYSAIHWIMDRYQVKTDSKSGIVNDPNRKDDPEYIIRLLKSVINVSVKTVELVDSLSEITDWGVDEKLRKAA